MDAFRFLLFAYIDCACIVFFVFVSVYNMDVYEYRMNDLVLVSMIDDICLGFRVSIFLILCMHLDFGGLHI